MILKKNFIILIISCLFCSGVVFAQSTPALYRDYFDRYKNIAIEHMKHYKIPASITLAQGVLESGAGKSRLAREGNNHFGIKCHDWSGKVIYHDDDKKGECFRKYKKPEESYHDHALFLKDRPRYAALFNFDIQDYRAWALGLQQCGYATDPNYATKLIRIIEEYGLYRFDMEQKKTKTPKESKERSIPENNTRPNQPPMQVYKSNGLVYVHAHQGDTFGSIARNLGFKEKNLVKYNELPVSHPLKEGDVVYLQKKKSKAAKPNYEHIVSPGESMHSIATKYGITIASLYKLNKKESYYSPRAGDVLRLR